MGSHVDEIASLLIFSQPVSRRFVGGALGNLRLLKRRYVVVVGFSTSSSLPSSSLLSQSKRQKTFHNHITYPSFTGLGMSKRSTPRGTSPACSSRRTAFRETHTHLFLLRTCRHRDFMSAHLPLVFEALGVFFAITHDAEISPSMLGVHAQPWSCP